MSDVHYGAPGAPSVAVSGRHDMRETDKIRFLNAPVSQTGLFSDAVENFAQDFSTHEQLPLSMGPRGVVDGPVSYHSSLFTGSSGKTGRMNQQTTHLTSAGKQARVAHTQTPLRTGYKTPQPGPCVPPCCPTVCTSVVPLVPLVRSVEAWMKLPSLSPWLLWTIQLGYAIQFARRSPKFSCVRFTSVNAADAPVLRTEISGLLAKDAIEPVPPAHVNTGFYSPYFIVPKKGGGLRPILDLRVELKFLSMKTLLLLIILYYAAAHLYSCCDQLQLDASSACQCSLACFNTLSRSEIPISSVISDVTSPFPSSGNEGYMLNQDVFYMK